MSAKTGSATVRRSDFWPWPKEEKKETRSKARKNCFNITLPSDDVINFHQA